jgi:hypothetical protein
VVSRRGLTGLVVVAAALLFAAAAPAAPRPVPGEQAALASVRKAAKAGRLDPQTAATDRKEILRAARLIRGLPFTRHRYVQSALEQVAAVGSRLTAPRALAVFGQLRANDDWFARRAAPAASTDITDADGIVYRFFTDQGFEFHPLANFGALNARVAAKDVPGAQRLADALAARGIHGPGGSLSWEYYFHFEGGRPPWTSGMAQAVAAQAFARAALLVSDESATYLADARAAYLAIPGRLTTKLPAGPWIRLYSFRTVAVLNAQLQSVLSLQSYANHAGDSAAAALATQMEQAAAASLARFDTGYWIYYSLEGAPSPLSYFDYVLQLLQKLSPQDPRFSAAKARFAAYLREPPAFQVANAPAGSIRFWLSKPAYVTVAVAGGWQTLRLNLAGGWHTLRLVEPKPAGIYGVQLTAVDPAGNRASFPSLPVVSVGPTHKQATARTTASPGASAMASAFTTGIGIDDVTQAPQAQTLGLQLVRLTVPWQTGQTVPDPTLAASLASLPSGTGLVIDLDAAQLPTDDAGRAQLAAYAASLAQQAPMLRDLFLTPAPVPADPAQYADALAAVRASVRGARADVAVGAEVDGSVVQARQTVLAASTELVRAGQKPDVVAFSPAAQPARGAWAAGDVASLESTLAKGFGTAPPVLLEPVPVPTSGPGAVSPAAQASAYATAIGDASCMKGVSGVLFDRLADSGTAATGLYSAGGAAKPSAAAVAQEAAAAARGTVVCPGLAARVDPTALTFPTSLAGSSAAAVSLGCDRDCLYLVSLLRGNGRPLVAARGSLKGGFPARTITLPGQRLAPGRYRFDVRLLSRVDPGAVTRRTSPWLTAG